MQGWTGTIRHGVQEKEAQEDLSMRGISLEKRTVNRWLLILDIKPLRS